MRSISGLLNLATSLSQNTSAANQTTMLALLNEQHRLLLENYFDNETTFTTETIGAMNLTLTTEPVAGDTSATLTSAWTYASGVQNVSFPNQNTDYFAVQFTNGSATITWQEPLTGDTNSTSIATTGFQSYRLPTGISKITDSTITVGQLKFVPAPVNTRADWDKLNFLPYSSDIPNYYFIYGPYLSFWPVPSTTGNKISFNYKTRVPDFSTNFLFSSSGGAAYVAGQQTYDYQKGTLTDAADDGVTITGDSTAWATAQGPTGGLGMPTGVDVSQLNLYLVINQPYGDGFWYPIQQFTDDTHLILQTPIMNTYGLSSATYSIGQLPLMPKSEDFQDCLVYGALKIYFSSIVPDPNKYKQFDKEFQDRMAKMAQYVGTKQISYNLGENPPMANPNSYPYYPGQVANS